MADSDAVNQDRDRDAKPMPGAPVRPLAGWERLREIVQKWGRDRRLCCYAPTDDDVNHLLTDLRVAGAFAPPLPASAVPAPTKKNEIAGEEYDRLRAAVLRRRAEANWPSEVDALRAISAKLPEGGSITVHDATEGGDASEPARESGESSVAGPAPESTGEFRRPGANAISARRLDGTAAPRTSASPSVTAPPSSPTEQKRTPRGFRVYCELDDSYGAAVRVQESSAAGAPFVWIFSSGGEVRDNHGSSHLSLDQAVALRDGLSAFIADFSPASAALPAQPLPAAAGPSHDEKLAEELEAVVADYFTCCCTPEYTKRKMRDPDCDAHDGAAETIVCALARLRAGPRPSPVQWSEEAVEKVARWGLSYADVSGLVSWASISDQARKNWKVDARRLLESLGPSPVLQSEPLDEPEWEARERALAWLNDQSDGSWTPDDMLGLFEAIKGAQ